MLRGAIRGYRKLEVKLKNPLVLKGYLTVQIAVCVVFAVLSGLDESLNITDASPFYVVNFVVTAFGLLAVHKRHAKMLVIYLIVHFALVIALSFGIGKFFSTRSISQRLCELENISCSYKIDPINKSIIRNVVLCIVEVIFLHPTTTFVIHVMQQGGENVVKKAHLQ